MKNKIIAYTKKIISRISPVSFAALIAFILLSLCIAYAVTPLDGEKELRSGIIRFHVLANSDSDEDQALKLLVRDAVTKYTTEILADCKSINAAKEIISQNSHTIIDIANKCIADNGYSYDTALELGFENYPRRTYGKYTFPAGSYYSVRLKIGDSKGKNWWCVLFPPMCLGGATVEKYEDVGELQDIGFSDSQIELISEPENVRTEIRFFALDFLSKFS